MKNLRNLIFATLMLNISANNMNTEDALLYINDNTFSFSKKVQDAVAAKTNQDMSSVISDLSTVHNISAKIIGYVFSFNDIINPTTSDKETIKVFVNVDGGDANHYHLLDGLSTFDETKDSYFMTESNIKELKNHANKSTNEISKIALLTMQSMIKDGKNFDQNNFINALIEKDSSNDQLYAYDFNNDEFLGTQHDFDVFIMFQELKQTNKDLAKIINNKYSLNYKYENMIKGNSILHEIYNYIKDDDIISLMDQTIIPSDIQLHLDEIYDIYHGDHREKKKEDLYNYFNSMDDQVKAEELAESLLEEFIRKEDGSFLLQVPDNRYEFASLMISYYFEVGPHLRNSDINIHQDEIIKRYSDTNDEEEKKKIVYNYLEEIKDQEDVKEIANLLWRLQNHSYFLDNIQDKLLWIERCLFTNYHLIGTQNERAYYNYNNDYNVPYELRNLHNIYDDSYTKQLNVYDYFRNMTDQTKADEIATKVFKTMCSNIDYGYMKPIKSISKEEITKSQMDEYTKKIPYTETPDY